MAKSDEEKRKNVVVVRNGSAELNVSFSFFSTGDLCSGLSADFQTLSQSIIVLFKSLNPMPASKEDRELICQYPECGFLATNRSGATRHFLAIHDQQPILYRRNIVVPLPTHALPAQTQSDSWDMGKFVINFLRLLSSY